MEWFGLRDPCGDCGRSKKRKASSEDSDKKRMLGSGASGEYGGYVDSMMVSDYVERAELLSEINQRLMARCAEVEAKLAEIEKLRNRESSGMTASPLTMKKISPSLDTTTTTESVASADISHDSGSLFKITDSASVESGSAGSARQVLLEGSDGESDVDEPPPNADAEKILKQGVAFFTDHNFPQARHHFRLALCIARRSCDHLLGARALGNLANVYSADDKPQKAHKYFRKALSLLRQLRETKMESLIISNGVVCCVQLGKYDEALGLALRKMAISDNVDEYREAEGWIEKLNTAINSGDDVKMEVPNSGGPSLNGDDIFPNNEFGDSPDVSNKLNLASVRDQLREMYEKYNPAKLAELDNILQAYSGREQLLLDRVTEKYAQQ